MASRGDVVRVLEGDFEEPDEVTAQEGTILSVVQTTRGQEILVRISDADAEVPNPTDE